MVVKERLAGIEEKLDNVEERITKLNDRDSRKKQFKLQIYSMVLGAIIALSIPFVMEFLKLFLEGEKIMFFIGISMYVSIYVFLIIWAKSKQLMDIGDFIIEGNINIIALKKKKSFIKKILKIVNDENNTLECKLHPRFTGLNYLWYLRHNLRENFDRKLNYCLGEIKSVKELEIFLSNRGKKLSSFSQITLNFENKTLIIELYDKHFSTKNAKNILSKIKNLKNEYNFFKEKFNTRGF